MITKSETIAGVGEYADERVKELLAPVVEVLQEQEMPGPAMGLDMLIEIVWRGATSELTSDRNEEWREAKRALMRLEAAVLLTRAMEKLRPLMGPETARVVRAELCSRNCEPEDVWTWVKLLRAEAEAALPHVHWGATREALEWLRDRVDDVHVRLARSEQDLDMQRRLWVEWALAEVARRTARGSLRDKLEARGD